MTKRTDRLVMLGAVATVIGVVAAGYFTTSLLRTRPEETQLGAKFQLVADDGKPITDDVLKGHPSLLFFGFTHCPEICPTTLFEMSGWFQKLGPEAKDLHAYFFSVDPERDTPEIMHSYISSFSDRITGITGDPQEVQRVIKGWRIYAKKVPTDNGDYTMDHTASVLLVDREGNLKSTIVYQESENSAVEKIRNFVR